jgi:hypothetical protein
VVSDLVSDRRQEMEETLDEDMLEQLYWEFDTERNRESERDIFKRKMRFFVRASKYQTTTKVSQTVDLSQVEE